MQAPRLSKASPRRGRASRTARPRAARLSAEARRDHLLDVAAELLLADGFAALTMERVAERAGVSKGLGYAYFTNADDLAAALWQREVARVYQRVERALAGSDTLAVRMWRALHAYFDLVDERGTLFAVLQANLTGGRMARTARGRLSTFVKLWASQLERALDLPPADARILADCLLGAVDAAARDWKAARLPRADVERVCAAFVGGGVRAAARRPRVTAASRGVDAN